MASYLLISHIYTYHFYYFDLFYALFGILTFIFYAIPHALPLAHGISHHIPPENCCSFLLFSLWYICSIFSFFILNKSKTQPLPHRQKTCCQVLPTPLEDAQMPVQTARFIGFLRLLSIILILPCRGGISSPKEASRSAEAAFLGASAMFMASFWGNLGCCQVLPSWKPVFQALSACMRGLIFHSDIVAESLECTGNATLLYHSSAVCRDDNAFYLAYIRINYSSICQGMDKIITVILI